jgi:hypothetical protein
MMENLLLLPAEVLKPNQEELDLMVSRFLRDLPGLFHNQLIRPVVYLSLQFRSTVKSRLS